MLLRALVALPTARALVASRRLLSARAAPLRAVGDALGDVFGGEWAGWQCDFDASSGALVPVPEHYCSETRIEWGQIPPGFEVLSSEAVGPAAIERSFLRILPEEGCAVDDLAGERSSSELAVGSIVGGAGVYAADADDTEARGEWRLRTVFAAPAAPGDPAAAARRVRVSLSTDAAGAAPSRRTPRIRVAVERRWSASAALETSPSRDTKGNIARAGVASTWLTKKINAPCFGTDAAAAPAGAGVALPGGVAVAFVDGAVRVSRTGEDGVVRAIERRFEDGKLTGCSFLPDAGA